MAITEDLDRFLADFGVSCTAGAVTAKGILDMPGEVVAGPFPHCPIFKLWHPHRRRFDHR